MKINHEMFGDEDNGTIFTNADGDNKLVKLNFDIY
jgi:hypothetical protein